MLTVKLNEGTTVLAKQRDGYVSAMKYANRKQAQAAAAKYGGDVILRQGRALYIRIPQPVHATCNQEIADWLDPNGSLRRAGLLSVA